jgi:hypothetical protein
MKRFHEKEIESAQRVIEFHLRLTAQSVATYIQKNSKIQVRVVGPQDRGLRSNRTYFENSESITGLYV